VKPKSELNRTAGNAIDVFGISQAALDARVTPALAGSTMPKKRPDKQQNQEEPPLSLGRDMPQPARVDDEAFARRAGEIIANSITSLHKPGAPAARWSRTGAKGEA
jgi:hypothetical protein